MTIVVWCIAGLLLLVLFGGAVKLNNNAGKEITQTVTRKQADIVIVFYILLMIGVIFLAIV